MKHCYPDGSRIFQDDSAPNHKGRGLTAWMNMKINHFVRPSQLPDLDLIENELINSIKILE